MKKKGTFISHIFQAIFIATIIGLIIFDIARVEMFILLLLYIIRVFIVMILNIDNPYQKRRERLKGKIPSNG